MNRTYLALATLTLSGATVLSTGGIATGGMLHPTTVTIKAEQTDLSGQVKSHDPATCAEGRKVIVYKQKGSRGGGDDERFASDTASLNGDIYQWSTGTTGTEGRFYAKVRKTDACKGDTSKTIRAVRND